jgi:hypothetical protein
VSKDSDQTETAPRKFKLGPLGSLNQVTKGLAKTILARASSVGGISRPSDFAVLRLMISCTFVGI